MVVPAPGAVLTFTGPVSLLIELADSRPRFVYIGYVDVAGQKARRSVLVDTLWPEEDRFRIEFSDRSVPDMVVGADEDVTFHVVDIDRPDLAQFGEDGYVVRMEPRGIE
ncbi:hypothetical protein [Rhodococcus sp. SORGH_AS_0303]|uniref:hypothetical protein n=1 Tax=Rhodococcus sp. SORGH_AS_0303 TaxID=3041753 RepID=UPI002786CCA8|nr:hypothetical protein [Rhodococcus sp. SORGH_AS_0303]MDQ1203338.1 hypothetical protein [Rhodococcus sp. SORGH_AS_0303]